MKRPLEGLVVLEFAQYLAGPYAGMRLADLGARVIKVERPGSGDAGRALATKNIYVDGDSLVFHSINRNKESFAADLKKPADLAAVKQLIAGADVMTHNFRPGVMEKIGLDYEKVRILNPRLIYGEVTGYGTEGPWRDKPGQDLLAQSLSGLTTLTGSANDPPTPFGLATGDMLCGTHFAQGIMAALLQRSRTGRGSRVEVSLLESLLDLQFEVLTTHFNDGQKLPQRARHRNAHAYLGAPYGIYETADGYLAIAMGSLIRLGELISLPTLAAFDHVPADRFARRNEIKLLLAGHFKTRRTADWLAVLEPSDYWCADVFNYGKLLQHPACIALGMDQTVRRPNGTTIRTVRCPLRIDGERLCSDVAAPALGNANASLTAQPPRPLPAKSIPATAAPANAKPLTGVLVVDFSQFLSGPSASLRLADLGARVIKVERPGTGDICRQLYVSNVELDGESTVFHAINRNKESFSADLKEPADLAQIKALVARADIVMHNFRPGVMEKFGLDYAGVRALNPRAIYGSITGYGPEGPWRDKPGQDLLVQALSGLTWLSGNAADGPVPMGISIVDIFAGSHLTQGLLACLVRRAITGEGGRVDVSMLESVMDLQFEPLTVYFQDGGQEPQRTASNNAHAYLGAPYGIYATADGHLALAMGRIPQIGELLGCAPLIAYTDPASWFKQRDEIKATLAAHLRTKNTADWLAVLEPADVWCADVLDWSRLRAHEGYRLLGMEQTVRKGDGFTYRTTRCPIRINGERMYATPGSPDIGEHNERITRELLS